MWLGNLRSQDGAAALLDQSARDSARDDDTLTPMSGSTRGSPGRDCRIGGLG